MPDNIIRCPGCLAVLEPDGESPAGAAACERCGYVPGEPYDSDYLRPGTALCNGRYFVGVVAAANGEGATYLVFDNSEQKACWLREYYPTTLAQRDPETGEVHPRKGNGAQYKALMSDFAELVDEVRRFAMTESVLPVLDFFTDKRTCYAVYPRLKLLALEEFLVRSGGSLPIKEAARLLSPLFNTVAEIHDHGFIHRGISPSTVYVGEGGEIYLWGFSLGAARTLGSELDAELFNGYSAPEQYSPNGWQGAWTDVYALAALTYRVISGFVPPKSTLIGDARPLASLKDLADVPEKAAAAVSLAMQKSAEKRTQSAYSLLNALLGEEASNTAVFDTRRIITEQEKERRRQREDRDRSNGGFKYTLLALLFTVALLFCGALYLTRSMFPDMFGAASSSRSYVPEPLEPDSGLSSGDIPESSGELSEPGSVVPQEEKVPSFIGEELLAVQNNAAYSELFEFSVTEEFNDDYPEGHVFDQTPEENTVLQEGKTPVALSVSKGPEMAEMPDVIGLSFMDALKVLGEQDLACDRKDRYVLDAAPDSVVSTTPAAGEIFNPKEQLITLYVMPEAVSAPPPPSSAPPSSSSRSDSGISLRPPLRPDGTPYGFHD